MLLLGSCFTDEIGSRLDVDGFRTVHNPLGPLYNPVSLNRCVDMALSAIRQPLLVAGPRGIHALDFASRYSGEDADAILECLEEGLDAISRIVAERPVAILTLGSAFVFRHKESGCIVGNCHKFSADCFERVMLGVDELSSTLEESAEKLLNAGCRAVLFTVSPIRHLADGLHGNTLSKSSLQLAVNHVLQKFDDNRVAYFPSFEILMDDLRDYRFYAADMKHPSETAVDYIYSIFSETYFSKETIAAALEARRQHLASLHRPIL